MGEQYEVRTDLALEASESLKTKEGHLNGISVQENKKASSYFGEKHEKNSRRIF